MSPKAKMALEATRGSRATMSRVNRGIGIVASLSLLLGGGWALAASESRENPPSLPSTNVPSFWKRASGSRINPRELMPVVVSPAELELRVLTGLLDTVGCGQIRVDAFDFPVGVSSRFIYRSQLGCCSVAYFCNGLQSREIQMLSRSVGVDGRLHVVVPRVVLAAIDRPSAVEGVKVHPMLPRNVELAGFSESECGLEEDTVEVVIMNLGQVDFAFPNTILTCLRHALVDSGDLILLSTRPDGGGLPSSWSEALESGGFRLLQPARATPGSRWVRRFTKGAASEGGTAP